ncbi:hypothetical protein F5Y10DRAFT_202499 [Nemania abortiva]|nr:hypothetical protein F5Y10DRAFT_202499 [Nemania abortiva]
MESYHPEPTSPTPSTMSTTSISTSMSITSVSTASTDSVATITIPPPVEENVNIFDPMPHRYMFVPDRNKHTIAACRERTHAIGRPVYLVHDSHGGFMGLRVPHYVVDRVVWEMAVKEEEEKERLEKEKMRAERGKEGLDTDVESASDSGLDSNMEVDVPVDPNLDLGINPDLGIFTEEDLEIIFQTIGKRPEPLPAPGELDWIVDDDELEYSDEGYGSGSDSDAGSDSDCTMVDDDEDEDEYGEYEDDEILDLDWTVGERGENRLQDEDDVIE